MASHQDPQVETEFDDFDEDERLLLESHIKKNQASEPAKFTVLYWLIAVVTVLAITYLFQAVIDLNFLEPINFLLFLVSGGATTYLLSESYMQMYDTESSKSQSDANGLWIKDLEIKMVRKADRIRNKAVMDKAFPAVPRTALEIFQASGKTTAQWKTLSKDAKQDFFDQEAAEECACLSIQVADLKHLQYQQSMGWALFSSNVIFVGIALVLSNVLLRSYDARVNYLISTFVTGVVTQLVAKRNADEATKTTKKTN